MSATNPLKKIPGQFGLRALRGNGRRDPPSDQNPILKCTYRPADADFYCWKFGVWYNLSDCCYRHAFRTFTGCADCGQGASNLKARRQQINAHRARVCGWYAR